MIIFRAKRANGVCPKCMRDICKDHLCTRAEAKASAEHVDCAAPDWLPRPRPVSRTFAARWHGWCPRCDDHIDHGDLVHFRHDVLEHAEAPCPGWTAREVTATA